MSEISGTGYDVAIALCVINTVVVVLYVGRIWLQKS